MQGAEEEGAEAEGGDRGERLVVLLIMACLWLASKSEGSEDGVA